MEDGGDSSHHFTKLYTNDASAGERLINLSEYIEALIGEDDLCGKTQTRLQANLNLNDGGKNTKALRDTFWNGTIQKMQTHDGVPIS